MIDSRLRPVRAGGSLITPLRSDDLLLRERVGHDLGAASAKVREVASRWRADRMSSTREQTFPPTAVMEPQRQADRLIKAIEDTARRSALVNPPGLQGI